MNSVFSAAFSEELSTVERVLEPSTSHPGWGSDLSCTDDVTADFAELDGNDPRILAEYTYRRINTSAGELADDPDWGFDVETLLHKGVTEKDLVNVRNVLRAEIARDERLRDVVVEASYNRSSEALTLNIGANVVDSNSSFLLTVVVDRTGSNLVELIVDAPVTAY